ncbi:MAG: hypothetical protein K0S33_4010 [Bacteroidetes bacterium]|jgi:hypothetical protein|nr:hypothetical protein [Bacteroidota bacterium]
MCSFTHSILSFSLIFTFLAAKSQSKAVNDFTAILHEETLNKVFTAIGTIKGSNDFEVMLIKGRYNWTVIGPKISIRPDSSQFSCDAKVDVGPFSYTTKVPGHVKITYDQKKNEIQVKIVKAIFELYTYIFGKKVHIKDIDIAEYLTEPFIFEGPKSMATDFEFMMPDSTMKHIYIQPSVCEMEVRWKEIVTRCEVDVSDKPFKTLPLVVPKTTPTPTTVPQPTTTVQAPKPTTTPGKK